MNGESLYCPTCIRSVVSEEGGCPHCGLTLSRAALVECSGVALGPTREAEMSHHVPPGYVAEAAAVDEEGAYRAMRSMSTLHLIGVRDRSISMRWRKKAREANEAFRDLVENLAAEENRDGFMVSVLDFHHRAEVMVPRMRAIDALRELPDLRTGGNGTDYVAALSLARAEAERPRDTFEGRPVVVILGDGGHNGPGDPRVEARRLHKVVELVVAVAFGEDADEDLLRNHIASESTYFWRIRESGAELRQFFADLGRTLSYSLQSGASPALGLHSLR